MEQSVTSPRESALAGHRRVHDEKRVTDGRSTAHKCLVCAEPAQWAHRSGPEDSSDPHSPKGRFAPGRPDRLMPLCVAHHADHDAYVSARLREAIEGYEEPDLDLIPWRKSDMVLAEMSQGLVDILTDEGWL